MRDEDRSAVAGGGDARRLRSDLRQTILEATRRIIDEQGLQAATTRHIASLAGCAEGTIYRHFEDKHQLFLELFGGSYPPFIALAASLPERAGTGSVRATLEELGCSALSFYRSVLPFVGGAIVDPELREEQRRRFDTRDRGPVFAFLQVERYLEAERARGRLGRTGSAAGAARALLGATFARAFLTVWLGSDRTGDESDEAFVAGVVDTLLRGLGPGRRA